MSRRLLSCWAVTMLFTVTCSAGSINPASSLEGLWWDESCGATAAGNEYFASVLRLCPGGHVVYSSMLVLDHGGIELGRGWVWEGKWWVEGQLLKITYKCTAPPPIEGNYVPFGTEEHTILAISPDEESLDGISGHYERLSNVKQFSLSFVPCPPIKPDVEPEH